MQTDRELLELAAKSAGIEHPRGEHCLYGPALWDCEKLAWWRPLTDDGDALRLAATLELDLNLGQAGTLVYMKRGTPTVEEYSDDYMAACRRAIVRAAAEIGRAMP